MNTSSHSIDSPNRFGGRMRSQGTGLNENSQQARPKQWWQYQKPSDPAPAPKYQSIQAFHIDLKQTKLVSETKSKLEDRRLMLKYSKLQDNRFKTKGQKQA